MSAMKLPQPWRALLCRLFGHPVPKPIGAPKGLTLTVTCPRCKERVTIKT